MYKKRKNNSTSIPYYNGFPIPKFVYLVVYDIPSDIQVYKCSSTHVNIEYD